MGDDGDGEAAGGMKLNFGGYLYESWMVMVDGGWGGGILNNTEKDSELKTDDGQGGRKESEERQKKVWLEKKVVENIGNWIELLIDKDMEKWNCSPGMFHTFIYETLILKGIQRELDCKLKWCSVDAW